MGAAVRAPRVQPAGYWATPAVSIIKRATRNAPSLAAIGQPEGSDRVGAASFIIDDAKSQTEHPERGRWVRVDSSAGVAKGR